VSESLPPSLIAGALLALCFLLGVALLVKRIEVELRLVSQRVGSIEQHQLAATHGIAGIGTGLAQTDTVARGLVDATTAIREELSRAKTDLTEIQAYARARRQLEDRTAESIRRLEAVIAGTHSKGAAGENLLEVTFSRLPAEWQVRDFRVGNRTVEFGLRLPNGLILPIDSKWPATHLLEAFFSTEDADQKLRLKAQIQATVVSKAREVRKYADPGLTTSYGIAAVPDAVYDLCWGAQVEAMRQNVVLISYSMLVPYLLLVFQTVLNTSRDVDLERLNAHLARALESTQLAQEELEGRYARALTMLSNARDEVTRHLGKISSSLLAVRTASTDQPGRLPIDVSV
jgi:DNA recombination protein RmuC